MFQLGNYGEKPYVTRHTHKTSLTQEQTNENPIEWVKIHEIMQGNSHTFSLSFVIGIYCILHHFIAQWKIMWPIGNYFYYKIPST